MRAMPRPIFAMMLITYLAQLAYAGPGQATGAGRPPRLDDFLHLEEFGLVRPSPDGRLLAVEIRRPRLGERFVISENPVARSDIWIVDTRSRHLRRITNGALDGSWYASPIWSPDGQRLALLAGDVEGNVRLAVWNSGTGAFGILAERSVDLNVNFGSPGPYPPHGRLAAAWVGDGRLLAALLPEGDHNLETALTKVRHARTAAWKRTDSGETAATVWDSRSVSVCNPDSTLMLIDVEEKSLSPLFSGAVRAVSVSPDRRHAAVVHAVASRRTELEKAVDMPLAWNAYTLDAGVNAALAIVGLRKGGASTRLESVAGLNSLSLRRFPRWSADSRRLAVPARSIAGKDLVFQVSLSGFTVTAFDTPTPLDAEILAELLIAGRDPEQKTGATGEPPDTRTGAGRESLVVSLDSIDGEVVRLEAKRVAVLSGHEVSVLGPDGSLHYAFPAPAGGLVHPSSGNREPAGSLLFDSGVALARVETGATGARVRTIPKPRSTARLVATIGNRDSYVLAADDDDGSFLWLTDADGKAGEPLIAINTDVARLIAPERRILHYRLPGGERRQGLMLLPPGYEDGRRYPAAIHVYPGVEITEARLSEPALNRFYAYPRTLLAAAGYVVLYPDIPVPQGSYPVEISAHVADNVLPAVDALIGQGYADASRIGVYGHSYGGYATLALVTRSDRFHAAVASASFSDLISYHDAVRPEAEMLACGPSIARFAAFELETRDGILRMRAPPLAAFDRYIRNSPYFQLRSVRTPVLLLHGALDPVPAEHAERVFVALDRMGVPTRFVRYWGEGHNLQSPGNIRHSWVETLRWFDTHVRGDHAEP